MSLKGNIVYTANNKTGKVDTWVCTGEFSRTENGKVRERVCFLSRKSGMIALPKRCVFGTKDEARAALKK